MIFRVSIFSVEHWTVAAYESTSVNSSHLLSAFMNLATCSFVRAPMVDHADAVVV